MNVAKPLKFYTLEDFEKLSREYGWNYELIDGVVMMSPRPAMKHQRVSSRLLVHLWNSLKGKDCEPVQEVELALEEDRFIPDLMVICNDNLDSTRYEKPPLIAIEIVSPTSGSRDYITKRRKYEQLGIQEYWIVSPEEKCITVFYFVNKNEAMYCEETMKSFVLPDVEINLEDIFV